MMEQLQHLRSPRRRAFVMNFVETGNAIESARTSGYFRGSEDSLRKTAWGLRYSLREEISSMMRDRLKSVGPKALVKLETLMEHGESEQVQLSAAKELLERSRILEGDQGIPRSIEQMEAELISLVGPDGARLMLGSIRMRRSGTGPSTTGFVNGDGDA